MQGQEHILNQMENNLHKFILFDGIIKEEENKIQFLEAELNVSYKEEKNKDKKQGRPRGEKNAQSKVKRAKDDIALDKKQRGHWSLEENKRYHWFLEIYHLHFIRKEMRRLDKIFKTMATFVGTREAEQCRSHHQKMEKKYQSFSKILVRLREDHYGVESIDGILRDIDNLSGGESVSILSCEELRAIESERKQKEQIQEFIKYQEKEQNIREKKNQGEDSLIADILGDHYEVQFDMNNLLI